VPSLLEEKMNIDDILVPVDFSQCSLGALDFAMSLVEKVGDITLLHVIDADFVSRVSDEGFTDCESATNQLRGKAEERLQDFVTKGSDSGLRMSSMVVIGKPFAEILRIAVDLHFKMIVMGIRGQRERNIEELLFGSTAEKVLRATRIPVICVPDVQQ
jgi:nucleotide-binding universal stress UspA family protein